MIGGGAYGARRPRVLVTRPSADAIPLAGELQRRGFDVLLQPLLRIELEDGPKPDLSGVQALLFTSANGVRAFARRSDIRTMPVFAVGDATAAAASAERFLSVASAGGDVGDLADLVRQRLDPAGGKLLHIAGSAVAGDLAGALGEAGFTVDRLQLYAAHRTETLDPSIHSALAAGAVDAAMFFSPRSAASFVSLVRDAALAGACETIHALCLSDAVAEALSPIYWRAIAVAPEPTQESLLATLEREVTDTSKPDTPQSDIGQSDTTAEPAVEPDADLPDGVADLLRAGNAAAVVERFGGIRPMATKLGIPVTTVQGWRGRGQIPANRIAEIRRAAAGHGIDLSPGAGDTVPGGASAGENTKPSHSDSGKRSAPAKAKPPEEHVKKSDSSAVPDAAPPPSVGGSGVAWAALILAVVALAGVASYRYWGPLVGDQPKSPAALAARIENLEASVTAGDRIGSKVEQVAQKLETLSRQVASLPAREAGGGAALTAVSGEMTALRSAVDALSRKIAEAESRAGMAGTEARDAVASLRDDMAALRRGLSDIGSRVKAIEDRPPATGEKIAALAVSSGQLETVVDSGQPYAGALERLKALAAGDAAIEQALANLEAAAKTGVPTTLALARQFAAIAPKLTTPAAVADGGGWTETLRAKAMSLINMRPVGDAGDASPVTRAERALARNDLAAAAAALDGVPGMAAPWREKAQRRLDADAALAALRTRIVERLAAETRAGTAGAAKREAP